MRDRIRAFGIDLGALAAGLILPLAFSPFGLFPVAIISPALLFGAWLTASPRRAFWRGWLFGLGMFGAGVSWVEISIHQFGVPSLWFSMTITAGFVMLMALYPAVAGYLATRLFRVPPAWKLLLVYPAMWTLIEWLRGWLFTGFPWLDLGYSQIASPLGGVAPVLGVYGVSLAAAWSGGILWYALRGGRSAWLRSLAALVVLWVAAGLLGRVQWTDPVGKPVTVALVQGNVPQAIKWLPDEQEHSLDLYRNLTAPYWGRDLIVWPETALPAFPYQIEPYLRALQQRAVQSGTDVLVGLPTTGAHGRHYYNSILGFGSHPGETYRKRHLVPFGEYLPFDAELRPLLDFLNIPMSQFSAGTQKQPLLRAAGHWVGVSICYEDAFGDEVIQALPQAAWLVNVSNDAWFGNSIAPHQHLEMARMRALETGRYMLRDTNTGVSAIIGPQGQIVSRLPQFKAAVLAGTIRAYSGMTPYARAGNRAIVGILCVLLLAAVFAGLQRRSAPADS